MPRSKSGVIRLDRLPIRAINPTPEAPTENAVIKREYNADGSRREQTRDAVYFFDPGAEMPSWCVFIHRRSRKSLAKEFREAGIYLGI